MTDHQTPSTGSNPVQPQSAGAPETNCAAADVAAADVAAPEVAPPHTSTVDIASAEPEPFFSGIEEPDYLPEPDEKAQRTARGAVVIGARVLTGVVGIVVGAIALGAAAFLPLPSHSSAPLSRVVTPVGTAQQRVCAGPLLAIGGAAGQPATVLTSSGTPSVRYSQSAGSAALRPLTATDNTTGRAPALLTLAPDSGVHSPIVTGSQTEQIASGDLVGLAAAGCAEPATDSWLIGGATETGRTTLVSLSNPSNVTAVVTLGIFSETGAVSAIGTDGISVPPGSQRVFSLAGFAPDVVSPVVRVQSRGGQVVANLQQSVVRTLEPGGVDIVGTSAAPSTLTTIPGLVLSNEAGVAARQAESGFTDLRSVIRLFVPGSVQAKAEIMITPEDGSAAPSPVRIVLQAGMVSEVPLDSYPDGSYTVRVITDQPVVAAARVSTVGATGKTDFAWDTSAATISNRALVVVAPGPSPTLHLANPTQKIVSATFSEVGEAAQQLTIPAGGAIAQPVTSGSHYSVTGFDSLAMSVSYLGDGELAGFAVSTSAPTAAPIRVYPSR